MAWNDERVETLKELWAMGLSASVIANRLGGVTRNAVLGKAFRMRLPSHTTKERKAFCRPKKVAKPKPRSSWVLEMAFGPTSKRAGLSPEPWTPAVVPETPPELRKALSELEDKDCRFPFGEGPYTFCAQPTAPGLPYCADHCRVAYQPPTPSRRQTADTFVKAEPVSRRFVTV